MRCRICGEHWDLDSLHEEVTTRFPLLPWYDDHQSVDAPHQHKNGLWHNQKVYETYFKLVVADFQKRGCAAIDGTNHNEERISKNDSDIIDLTYQLLGDDVDGAVNLLEDAESMGLFD